MKSITAITGGLCIGVAAIALAAPAFGQSEEIIVQGRHGRAVQDAPSASMPVSYADLDLSTPDGKYVFQRRVKLTARYLCEKLGESGSGDAVAPSCEQAAISDAMSRLGTIEQDVAPRDTAWVRPAPWREPYPTTWDSSYDDSYAGYP